MTITLELSQRFPDLLKSLEAMNRAAEQARRLAEQTGTRLIVETRPKCQLDAVCFDAGLAEWASQADEEAYRDL